MAPDPVHRVHAVHSVHALANRPKRHNSPPPQQELPETARLFIVRVPHSMSDAPPSPTNVPSEAPLDSSILGVLMDTIPDRIYFKDLESRFVRNNIAHAHSLGAHSPAECVGKTDFDFFSREHAEKARADELEIIRTGEPIIAKIEHLTMRNGRRAWGSTTKMRWHDANGKVIGTFGLTRDITATKEAEDRLLEERNLLRTIIDNLPSRLYVKDLHSRYVLNNRAHLELLGARDQVEATGRTTVDFFPGERGVQALNDDAVVFEGGSIVNQEKSDFGIEGDVRWSLVTKVPLHDSHGQLIGLIGISHDITRRKLAEQELQRRTTEMEVDLRMACQVQEAFLTRPYPVFPRGAARETSALRFAHRYMPASTLGGDFFDILQLSDSRCGVLVCDVMGHGVRAGLLTALVRGVVEEMGVRASDPELVLSEINRSFMPIVEGTGQPVFATVFFGVIDLDTHTLAYGNAGHPAPLVLRSADNSVERLAPPDPEPATGLLSGFGYSRHECRFEAGDMFLGYTDGVLEAANAEGQMFGEDRLRDFLVRNRGRASSDVCAQLLSEVETYSQRRVFEDDVCIVAVEAAK
ncbi:MAG TPA: SpoIIE family protein phosphatase [Opitutaceae bacterium]|nr:SpoIIE family protein phosphatase [Opitutaceae bacterium]